MIRLDIDVYMALAGLHRDCSPWLGSLSCSALLLVQISGRRVFARVLSCTSVVLLSRSADIKTDLASRTRLALVTKWAQ